MHADGFLSRSERHPVALTAAIAINVAAVGALLLAKSEYIVKPPKIFETIHVDPEVLPPEVKPERVKPEVEPPVTLPRTEIERPPSPPPPIRTTEIDPGKVPVFPLPSGGGTGAGTTPSQPRSDPPPVLTDAAVDPRFASLFQPPYPARLERLEVEGRVVLKVLIGADGRVKDVRIVYADDDGFADVSERQARTKWRFKPATRDGVAVETWKQLTVRFQIGRG